MLTSASRRGGAYGLCVPYALLSAFQVHRIPGRSQKPETLKNSIDRPCGGHGWRARRGLFFRECFARLWRWYALSRVHALANSFYHCLRQRVARISAAGDYRFRHAFEIRHEVFFFRKLFAHRFVDVERHGRNIIDSELREVILAVIYGIKFDEGEFLHGRECGVLSL